MNAKNLLAILALLALAGGGYWYWKDRATAGGPLVLQGNVEVRQVNIGFKVAGRIKSLEVDEGAHVKTGQKLDKDVFRRDLGSLTDAYSEVARRLGVLPTQATHLGKPTLIN